MNIVNFIFKSLIWSFRKVGYYYNNFLFKIKLKGNMIEYGKNVICKNSCPDIWRKYSKTSYVKLGNNVTFNSYGAHSWFCKCKLLIQKDGNLIIGDNSGLNGVMIYCSNSIEIGKYVNIGGSCRISDSNHHPLNYISRRENRYDEIKSSPIKIEDDVFIGANCIIGKGVTIGARSIISAGSVVIKDIPSDVIAGGNPCKVIKSLK